MLLQTLLFTLCSFSSTVLANKGHGWNDNIDWKDSLDALKKEVKETGKPGFVLIHKSWCGACKSLKPKFAGSKQIEAAAEDFVMYNALDDDEPAGAEFKPDGGYIPRILYIDPETMTVDSEIFNKGRDSYKYFYSSPYEIEKSMKAAKEKLNRVAKEEL